MPANSQSKLISLVLLGSVLEAYDYSLYGFFAPILGELFFPEVDPQSRLLFAFMVFAVGFITRPLGAAIFGNYGDRYGRKKMLMASIVLMAVPTALIGLLPTYAQIGISAGILLAMCRLLQGFAVGAEFVGTMIYTIEQAPAKKRILYGSLSIVSGYCAMLFTALIVMALNSVLSTENLQSWGWRIPFVFGLILGILGLYFRYRLTETLAFQEIKQNKTLSLNPFVDTITQMPMTVILGVGVVILHAFGFYFLFVYMKSYLTIHFNIAHSVTSLVNILAILIAIICLPLIAMFAEKIPKKYFIILSTSLIIIFALPLTYLLNSGTFLSTFIVQSVLTLLLCMTSAVLPSFLADLFPVSLRYTGMALSYNISAVIFGGTAPLILSFLIAKTDITAPSFYLMFCASITLISTLLLVKKEIVEKTMPAFCPSAPRSSLLAV